MMNFIYELIPQNIIDAIGWTIFHSLWQGVIISFVLAAVLLLSNHRSANFRYKLSVSALALLVFSAIVTFTKVYQPGNESVSLTASNLITIIDDTSAKEIAAKIQSSDSLKNFVSQFENYFSNNIPLIVTMWLAGILFFIFKFIGGLIYVERLKTRRIYELPADWLDKFAVLKNKAAVKSGVKIFESALTKMPAAIGYIKPVILLPLGMISGLPQSQVEAIIVHELAHIKRYDFLVNILQTLAETIMFYHPAIWWISSVIRSERENCCDDITVELCGSTITYSKALFNIQQINSGNSNLALAAVGNESQLFRRIKRMNSNSKKRLSYGIKFAALFLLILVIAAAAVYSPSSFASKNKNVSEASFLNPFTFLNSESGDDNANSKSIVQDTTSLRKGRRTIKFYESEGENRKKYKAKLNNGKIELLYIDGEKIPDNEVSKYENKVQQKVDEYDTLLKDYRSKKEEYRELAEKYSEELKNYREKLREYKNERNKLNRDNDFDFDFDYNAPDLSELRELMIELREDLSDEFVNGSLHIPPVNVHIPEINIPEIDIPNIDIPEINIPPIPPANFDDDWHEEFEENMEKFSDEMREHNLNMREFNKGMKKFGENMKEFGEEMRKFGDFIHEMRDELISEGVIESGDDIDDLLISENKMTVNGKELSKEQHKKYLDMYEKHTGKKLEGKQRIKIDD